MPRLVRLAPPEGCVVRVHTDEAARLVRTEVAPHAGAWPLHTSTRTLADWPSGHCDDGEHRLERLTYLFDKDGLPVDLSTCTVCPHAELTPGEA